MNQLIELDTSCRYNVENKSSIQFTFAIVSTLALQKLDNILSNEHSCISRLAWFDLTLRSTLSFSMTFTQALTIYFYRKSEYARRIMRILVYYSIAYVSAYYIFKITVKITNLLLTMLRKRANLAFESLY